jgi:hypothetical protein
MAVLSFDLVVGRPGYWRSAVGAEDQDQDPEGEDGADDQEVVAEQLVEGPWP